MLETEEHDVAGELSDSVGLRRIRVVQALHHSLLVEFDGAALDVDTDCQVRLGGGDRWIELGPCRYFPHSKALHRRATDAAPWPGQGRIVPLSTVIDFRSLVERGLVVPLAERTRQLPLLLRRKDQVSPGFRAFTSDLAYDLQVFRSLLDQVDRSLQGEPAAVAEVVRGVAVEQQWSSFCALFDDGLTRLEGFAAGFDKRENELHGFYFRKHMWDLILCSGFIARTNLKPRGYAGDSEMMRMIYEDGFDGPTIFSRFMHCHPVKTAAAQAVRNRRALLGSLIGAHVADVANRPGHVVKVMSVACGPAREIADLVTSPELAQQLAFTLVDQDAEALGQAEEMVTAIAARVGVPLNVKTVRDSVRTVLRQPDLAARWGRFDFIYSMGLFDYLVGPVAQTLLAKLYDLLEPGGEIVIGNFHVGNPTRVYMEYWMDWVLFYRNEEEMLALADALPGARARISFEETKSQMFLHVTRG